MVSFNQVAGAALAYNCPPVAPYRSKGQKRSMEATAEFLAVLNAACSELWSRLPEGKPDIILSAGAYVAKAGEHGKGAAIDIDGWVHGDDIFVTLDYPQRRAYYVGAEAVLRKHFGIVLNYRYNSAHQDHWHVDLSSPVGWQSGSRSRVLFVQMALAEVYGKAVTIDGSWGQQTANAVGTLGITNLGAQWKEFLDMVADEGLGTGGRSDPAPKADPNEPSAWAAKSWAWAHEQQLITGGRPHDTVTREELAVVCRRLVTLPLDGSTKV